MHFWCGMAFLEDTQIISICLNCGGENGILILGCRLTRILKYEICLKNFYRAILTSHVSQILRGVIWERQPSIIQSASWKNPIFCKTRIFEAFGRWTLVQVGPEYAFAEAEFGKQEFFEELVHLILEVGGWWIPKNGCFLRTSDIFPSRAFIEC